MMQSVAPKMGSDGNRTGPVSLCLVSTQVNWFPLDLLHLLIGIIWACD